MSEAILYELDVSDNLNCIGILVYVGWVDWAGVNCGVLILFMEQVNGRLGRRLGKGVRALYIYIGSTVCDVFEVGHNRPGGSSI